MSYCDVASVKNVKSVARLLAPEGSWSDDDISAKIDEIGSAVIDVRLKGVYEVPFAVVPEPIERICRLKTAYEMLVEEYGAEDGRFDSLNSEAEYLLRGIETKKLLLDSPAAETPAEGQSRIFNRNRRRFFGMEERNP